MATEGPGQSRGDAAASRRRILISAVGSAGDVHPLVALGGALRARGHDVLFAANPHFAKRVEAAGLGFLPQGEEAALLAQLRSPDLMHPRRGHLAVWRHLLEAVPASIGTAERAVVRFAPDLVVRHGLSHGVRQVAGRHGIPCAVAMPTPGPWLSLADRVAACGPLRGALLPRIDPALRRLRGAVTRRWIERPLEQILRRFGLPVEPDVLVRDWQEGVVSLGLWSAAFRPAMPDDPPGSVVCGFPWFDADASRDGLPDELEAFLQAGDPPLVFALGTTAVHAPGDFFACAAEACARLGRRGVLLVGHERHAAGALPARSETLAVCGYAPFSRLLPRARATVHHGGIGSTAQALRAGRPMLVVPHSLDQPVNAARLRRLGVAGVLARGRVSGPRLAEALRRLLGDAALAERARRLGARIAAEDGAEVAADRLEAWLARSRGGQRR